MKMKLKKIAQRLSALAMAGVMASSCLAPAMAFADNKPSTGLQAASGRTKLFAINLNDEYGGTAEPEYFDNGDPNPYYNPAEADGLGTNIKFTVPSALTFVINTDDSLIAPTNATIENKSDTIIHVSSLKVNQSDSWNIVSDASTSNKDNAISVAMTPAGGSAVDLSGYVSDKTELDDPVEWNMAAKDDASHGDVKTLSFTGSVKNLKINTAAKREFGEICWYFKSGEAVFTHDHFSDFTLAELKTVSANLSALGTSSPYYDTFNTYMTNGETWTVALTNLPATNNYAEANKVMNLRIIGINHDLITDGNGDTAGLTFQATHALPVGYCMQTTYSNAGGWRDSELRTTMNSGAVWNMLPSDLQSAIVAVDKKSNTTYDSTTTDTVVTTSDKLFVPSYVEIVGNHLSDWSDMAAKAWSAAEGTQYEWYAANVTDGDGVNTALANMNKTNAGNNIVKGNGAAVDNTYWWERSCCPLDASSFVTCNTAGAPIHNALAKYACGVVPCFCL